MARVTIQSFPAARLVNALPTSSLLLRVRFARFTNVFSLAVEDIVSLLGSIVFATWMGLGSSSLG